MKTFWNAAAAVIAFGAASLFLVHLACVPREEPLESDPHIGDIRLTEIQYHPDEFEGISDDSLEFIELKNVGSETVTLGALQCTEGVSYEFPRDARIEPRGFFVIASNKRCFSRRYGFDPDGVFSGQLNNAGEKIEIIDRASGQVVISQTYSDGGAWPGEADGMGYSLVPVDPNPKKDATKPSDWRGSSRIGGSPGKDDENKTLDSALLDLRITEIQYHPDYTDSIGKDSLEFVELKNVGSKTLDLTGVLFSSGIEYAFPAGASLKPGAFCVVASNSSWFKSRYGFKPYDTYKGQLRNSSDTLTIKEIKSGVTLLTVAYSDHYPWTAYPDGNGWTLVTKNPNPSAAELNTPSAWRASLRLHGSPGRDDPEPVYVNEALTHTDPPLTDAVELYNPGDAPVDLGNWFISDDIASPMKFRIPAGTTIPAKGYIVFDEHDFNANPSLPTSFRFSEYGEAVYLFADSIGKKGYYHGFTFGAAEKAVSFGRYITSTGAEEFVAQSATSLGAANKGPRVGPVVITEIMGHAVDTTFTYIEVKNISTAAVPLFNELDTTRTWRIQPIGFSFPRSSVLKAGEVALVVQSRMPLDSFKNRYAIPDSIQIFSIGDSLAPIADSVVLSKPYVDDESVTLPELPFYLVDRVVFASKDSWPTSTSGSGKSLQRIDEKAYANDPINWKVADPTPGR